MFQFEAVNIGTNKVIWLELMIVPDFMMFAKASRVSLLVVRIFFATESSVLQSRGYYVLFCSFQTYRSSAGLMPQLLNEECCRASFGQKIGLIVWGFSLKS